MSAWRSVRRFYRRHRTAVTSAALFAAAMALVGHVPLMPGADALYTPLSGVGSFILSPAAGGALLYRQRSRRAMWWYVLAMAAGTTAPMLYGYFHNIVNDGTIGGIIGNVTGGITGEAGSALATLASMAPVLLFVGGALGGYWLAQRFGRRRRR